jgi:anti-anti-sigma regulatory factor
MTGTRFFDSSGLTVVVRAHRRGLAEGGELWLVILGEGAVFRIFTIIRLGPVHPRFATLAEASFHGPPR